MRKGKKRGMEGSPDKGRMKREKFIHKQDILSYLLLRTLEVSHCKPFRKTFTSLNHLMLTGRLRILSSNPPLEEREIKGSVVRESISFSVLHCTSIKVVGKVRSHNQVW